ELEGKLSAFEKSVDVAVRYAEAVEEKAFRIGPGPSASLRLKHQVFDQIVYSKLRDALGGQCRGGLSGGSAMERRLGLFFDGNDRPYVSALVTLDADAVAHWLMMREKPELKAAELLRDPDLETEVRRAVVAANTQVSQAESIRTFRILASQFTEEQGFVTPSL